MLAHLLGKPEQIENRKRKLGGVDCFKERGNARGKGRPMACIQENDAIASELGQISLFAGKEPFSKALKVLW